jgi:hypothetical protein
MLEVASHPMIRELLDLVVPLIPKEGRSERLSCSDSYNLEIFGMAGALSQSFELLERSRNLIISIPSGKYLEGQNINHYDWIEYHISTFLVTFVTVRDEVLQLVNSVFCLGIDPRHCSVAVVTTNKWVMDTTIPKHLKAIENVISSHRTTRNLLVHRGKTPSLNIWFKSANLDQLRIFALAVQHKPEKIPEEIKTMLNEAYVVALTQISEGLDAEISQLKTAVWQLLTDLHNTYSERRSFLSFVRTGGPHDPQ